MPTLAKQLTDPLIRQAKRRGKTYTLPDGNGLHLQISMGGEKSWFVRYRKPDGSRSVVQIGFYPTMTLAQARSRAIEMRIAIKAGEAVTGVRQEKIDRLILRSDAEQAAKVALEEARRYSFSRISELWLESRKRGWATESYRKAQYVVRQYLRPRIGELDMRQLRTRDVTQPLRDIAAKAPSLGKKAVQYLNGIVDYAILEDIRTDDQVLRLRGVLPTYKGGHVPAVTREQDIGPLMQAIENYEGFVVRSALHLAAWTALRPGVIASARWSEMDLDRAEWHIVGRNADGTNRMKTGHDHIVSLPTQAVAMLKDMHKHSGGDEYVFPAVGKMRNPHLHRDALSKAIRDMGFKGQHSTHGFRAMLRTVARERLRVDFDVLEAQLAHAKRDQIQAAYDRTQFDDERREAMQRWADYLDMQVTAATVPMFGITAT